MRHSLILMSSVLLVGVAGCGGSGGSVAQDTSGGATTVGAQVTDAPTTAPTTTSPDTTSPTTTAAPTVPPTTAPATTVPAVRPLKYDADPLVAAFLPGAPLTLPAGTPGEVSVILQGPPNEITGDIPVIVRNMTDATVEYIQVNVEAVDAKGKVVDSALEYPIFPFSVPPGGIAIGSAAPFELLDLPNVTLVPTVYSYDDVGQGPALVQPVSISRFARDGGMYVGTLTNDAAKVPVSGMVVVAVCFDAANALIGSFSDGPDGEGDVLDVGESYDFSWETYGYRPECTRMLATATGYR